MYPDKIFYEPDALTYELGKRMSVNPQPFIAKVELGTSSLKDRIHALNQMCEAGYKVGLLIAPIVLVDNWMELYSELIDQLADELSNKAKKELFIEIIFMTYSCRLNTETNIRRKFDRQLTYIRILEL